ncbi:MAG: type II restriction endonuclease [Saccharofermentanales bacterium]
MQEGYLSHYFKGVATKRISAVEADQTVSNQHEFNGVKDLILLFGKPDGRLLIKSNFMYFANGEEPIVSDGYLSWYDARAQHPTRTEWRLYYPTNEVFDSMVAGDALYICKLSDDSALVIIALHGSTYESQLNWLFGFTEPTSEQFSVKERNSLSKTELMYASRLVLDEIGIEPQNYETNYLEKMLDLFKGSFPTTKVFSSYARSTLPALEAATDNPDGVLLSWLDREDQLFRTLEKHLISERLEDGFVIDDDVDVDGFIAYSLSVQNRRKSRAGQSLENHVEELFKVRNISYTRTPVTENRSRPDFIFPGIQAYNNLNFPVEGLSMLGVKSTCKDRWRQVLSEADRIEAKHLLTLEAAISENQTDEMTDRNLKLVIPQQIHKSYTAKQRSWLFTVEDFLNLTILRQAKHIATF